MNTELLKACFILTATVGLVLFQIGTKTNAKKLFRYFSKLKTKKELL